MPLDRDRPVRVVVNGVERRLLRVDFLHDTLGLAGTRVGCTHRVCSARPVLLDGERALARLTTAVQAHGRQVTTIKGLARDRVLYPVQRAFVERLALQYGSCTPEMVLAAVALLARDPAPSAAAIRAARGGNLCRYTGYQPIVKVVRVAARA